MPTNSKLSNLNYQDFKCDNSNVNKKIDNPQWIETKKEEKTEETKVEDINLKESLDERKNLHDVIKYDKVNSNYFTGKELLQQQVQYNMCLQVDLVQQTLQPLIQLQVNHLVQHQQYQQLLLVVK